MLLPLTKDGARRELLKRKYADMHCSLKIEVMSNLQRELINLRDEYPYKESAWNLLAKNAYLLHIILNNTLPLIKC